jgi:hypothetical protein
MFGSWPAERSIWRRVTACGHLSAETYERLDTRLAAELNALAALAADVCSEVFCFQPTEA